MFITGEDEVLATELELELAAESANDLDLSRLAFCRNFGSLEDEYEVDGVGEEFDGEWRDLLEVIVSRPDYVPTRLGPSLSSARVQNHRGKYLQSRALYYGTVVVVLLVVAVAVDKLGNAARCAGWS